MSTVTECLKIKDKEIPINIRNYKNSKSVKIFFRGNVLNITKPTRLSMKALTKILKQNENDIYNKYEKILSSEVQTIKQWKTGEKIYYKGTEFTITRIYKKTTKIGIELNENTQQLIITLPENILEKQIKESIDLLIKKLFKNNTEAILKQKIPYWSKRTGLEYNLVKVRDATSRYGSCMPSKKNLYFSSRLIMLPDAVIDAIVVHEFCHIIYKNHNKQFYSLVEKYIPNYKEIDKWLKENGKIIMF